MQFWQGGWLVNNLSFCDLTFTCVAVTNDCLMQHTLACHEETLLRAVDVTRVLSLGVQPENTRGEFARWLTSNSSSSGSDQDGRLILGRSLFTRSPRWKIDIQTDARPSADGR